MSSIFAPLKASMKQAAGQKLTVWDKFGCWWYDLWRYTWGFSHVRDFWWKLRHLLWDRYDLIRTRLPKDGYYDKPVLILHGMMELLVDFVEKEKCFEVIDFNSSSQWKEVGETVKEVYDWWKDYPNREKEITIALDNWHITKFANCPTGCTLHWINKDDTEESKRYSDIHFELEERLKKEEQEMLMKIIKIREGLWT